MGENYEIYTTEGIKEYNILLTSHKSAIISDLWEVSKVKLYGVPGSTQPHSQFSAVNPSDAAVAEGQRRSGKADKFIHSSCTKRVTRNLCEQNGLLKMAPPRYLCTWLMAGELWQLAEYYYYFRCVCL